MYSQHKSLGQYRKDTKSASSSGLQLPCALMHQSKFKHVQYCLFSVQAGLSSGIGCAARSIQQ